MFYTKYSSCLVEDTEDVVAQHHQWNCAPRLPDNAQLLAVRRWQISQNSQSAGGEDNHEGSVVNDLNFADARPSVPTTDVYSQPPSSSHKQPPATLGMSGVLADDADPSQLQSYSPAVRDIIKCAKQFSHCDIASINSFLLRPDFNRKAVKYINEATAKRLNQGLSVPEGKFSHQSRTQ